MKRSLLGLAFLAPALLFGQTDPAITTLQPTDPIQGSQVILNGNFTNLRNALLARPPATGSKTANAITVYDSDGNLVSSGCRVISGNLECGAGTASAGIELPELAANGTNSFAIYGKDNQAASACIIMPDAAPAAGEGLKSSGSTATTTDGKTCSVMEWGTAGGSDRVTAPTSPTDVCTVGQWAANESYFFYCSTTDTWVRSALSAWNAVSMPGFSPASPYSGAATDVTVTTVTSGAAIKYCTGVDNTCDPAAGTTYSSPVHISATGYLRAIATKTGMDDSAVASWNGTISVGGGGITDDFAAGSLGGDWADAWPANGYLSNYGVICTASSGVITVNGTYRKCAALNSNSALAADGSVQVDAKLEDSVGVGPIWRATADNYYYLTFSTDFVELRKAVAGETSYVAESHPTFAFTTDTWYTIKVTYAGSTFHVFTALQGGTLTEIASFSDSTFATGKPGFMIQDDGSAPYPQIDNFEAH